ncbi:MAG: transaldolase family protein [bacterium]
MKPTNCKTKIFLDSGDLNETKEAIKLLGFLDGQTTNPTLIAKNPYARERFERGEKFTSEEILFFYKNVAQEISSLLPEGSVSIEVYADKTTSKEKIIKQAKEMFLWIPNAHIKLPINEAGLSAAEELAKENFRLNMTLCFTQEQAAAVYGSTKSVKEGIFVSPFVGRLDDLGINGMDLIGNIVKMYKEGGDGHVEVLSASIRGIEHFLCSIKLGADIITAPLKILKEWADMGMPIPDENYVYNSEGLSVIKYEDIELNKDWPEYNIKHELTDKGIDRFASDWNGLIG